MTSLPVKDIGAMMSRGSLAGTVTASQASDSVSFESVLSNQTQKNDSAKVAAEDSEGVRREEDSFAGESLKVKDSHRKVADAGETTDASEVPKSDIREMSPEEWEKAMEVLGAAAVEMIQQIADAFGMTVEEVQGLMSELGMEQLDVLQQESLGQLILAAGGADGAASLLTDENLYQQYQELMTGLDSVLQEAEETLQFDAQSFLKAVEETVDKVPAEGTETEPVVEIAVDEAVDVTDTARDAETVKNEDFANEISVEEDNSRISRPEKKQDTDNQMQNQDDTQSTKQDAGQTTEVKHDVTETKAQGENLVLQNLKTESFEPGLQQVTQSIPTWDTETIDIMKQIMDYMRIQVKPDMSNLEMQLHPESLGTLQVQVASKGGVVTAQFVTQNDAVKAALETQMIQLKESFAEQGIKVEAIEVTVQTHQFEQNLEQGRERQNAEAEKKARPRKIQLDGAFTMDDLSAMDEETQLTAEMMVANGNTVDYTA